MLRTDRDALECDLAETYNIYNMEALTFDKLALFSFGLREDSRIKMKISGDKVKLDTLLLGVLIDKVEELYCALTGTREKRTSIVNILLDSQQDKDFEVFASVEDFEAELHRLKNT